MTNETEIVYTALAVIAALLNLLLTALAWRLPSSRQSRFFLLLAVAQSTWAIFYVGEIFSDDLANILTFAKLEYLGIVSAPVFWLLFSLEYSGREHLVTRRNIWALFVVPLFVLMMVWTNEYHDYHWVDPVVDMSQGVPLLDFAPGPVYLLNFVYAQLLLLIAAYFILKAALGSSIVQRRNALILIISWAAVWLVSFFYIVDSSPLHGYDLTPLVFGFAALISGSIIMDLHMLIGIPVAVDLVINGLRNGIIVLNPEGDIVQINQPALHLLELERKSVYGRPFTSLQDQHPELIEIYQSLITAEIDPSRRDEIILGKKRKGRTVELSINRLTNKSGHVVGQLVSIVDIEDWKRVQISAARRYSELAALRYIDARMTSTLDVEQVLEVALRSAIDMTAADAGFIALVDQDVHRVVQTTGSTPRVVGDRLNNATGTTGRVIRQRRPELVQNVANDPDFIPSYNGVASQIIIPLQVHDDLIGVLHLDASDPTSFSEESYAFAQTLGDRIAVALENAQLYTQSRQQVEELKKLYEHVSALEQTKTDMIRLASHDLRNPLGTVLGYLDLLELDKDQLSEEHQKYVSMMTERMEQMQRIVNDILTLEKLETEGKSLTLRSVDLQSLVIKALDTSINDMTKKSLSIIRQIPKEPVLVWADPVQIFEAIHNLLDNAIKYTPEKGQITVRLAQDDVRKMAVFEVSDTGYGIPQEMQDRLFEPFYRANRRDIQQIEGTGLGLHLVKSIVERQHGQVHFTSEVDKGSTFGFEVLLANR